MTKKNASQTGEIGFRNFVIRTPDNKYVHIYFGLRHTEVANINEATRFDKQAATDWIKTSTSEIVRKGTEEVVNAENIIGLPHSELIFRPSTKHKIIEVETKIVKEL